jgi:hypothetical protein
MDTFFTHRLEWTQWIASAQPTLPEQIDRWLKLLSSGDASTKHWATCQMENDGVVVLLRNQTNCVAGYCMTLATIRIEPDTQRKGLFKALLAHLWSVNPWPTLVVEDVGNAHLVAFLQRIGAQVLNASYKTTYVVPRESLSCFAVGPLLSPSAYRSLTKDAV